MIRNLGPGNETAFTMRRLKILVVLLLLSNIALGTFGFWGLKEIDRKYSVLISQTVPELNRLQTLTAVIAEAMRGSNPVLYSGQSEARAAIAEKARAALDRDHQLRLQVLEGGTFVPTGVNREEMERSGADFTTTSEQLLPLLAAGNNDAANRQREQVLRPIFERYMAATTKAADMLEQHGLRSSGLLSARTDWFSHLLLGFASWPLMLLLLFLAVTSILIIAILIRVRLAPVED